MLEVRGATAVPEPTAGIEYRLDDPTLDVEGVGVGVGVAVPKLATDIGIRLTAP
jgi:hypothetical protein